MGEQKTTAQAMGDLRRAEQMTRWLVGLGEAARTIMERESEMAAMDGVLSEKRTELARLEAHIAARTEQVDAETLAQQAELAQRRTAHAEALEALARELDERQRATVVAMGNEERTYLDQAKEHEAKLAVLQATIAEREGYLHGLERRIGELRASFEGVR